MWRRSVGRGNSLRADPHLMPIPYPAIYPSKTELGVGEGARRLSDRARVVVAVSRLKIFQSRLIHSRKSLDQSYQSLYFK